jgi:DNA-binding response OmpR family regulator
MSARSDVVDRMSVNQIKGSNPVPKILIVDDDEAQRGLMRMRLSQDYEIVDTSEPERVLGLALEHKPDVILMDLMMPRCSGFELCHSLHSLSYTSLIPIFMITGESAAKYQEHCKSLGAKGYFEKPVDFAALRTALDAEMRGKQRERRAHVRVRMHVVLRLKGTDGNGKAFEESAITENVSAAGFLCNCTASLVKGASIDVFLGGERERFVGLALVVRKESSGAPWQRYGFRFQETTSDWVIQST